MKYVIVITKEEDPMVFIAKNKKHFDSMMSDFKSQDVKVLWKKV